MAAACKSCGWANAPEARFCARCGAPLEDQRCRSCGAELPADARFCPACAAPVARSRGDDERKLATILFADVTGSTALGERLDPERLRVVLQTWFSAAAAAIESWGGTVEKYIGDAIVAVFGVPIVREDDAQRALHAALDLLDRLPELNRRFEAQHGVSLAVRVGVNTGEVIAPRAAVASEPLIAGDAANVAARLEQATEPGTILVGERTYVAARGAFRFSDPVDLEVKGKAAPVRARHLLAAEAAAHRGVPGLRAPMVGRERELRTLLDTLAETVESGRPQLVVVYGPAGIGKSRLLQEFVRASETSAAPVAILRGRCLAAGPGITYWPLAEILRAVCDISLDEPAEEAGQKLREHASTLLGPLGLSGEEAEETIHALAATAGLALPNDPLAHREPKEVADALARAWPRISSALAAAGPVVLVVEDLHWASEEVLAMLERILARAEGPLLLLATARPEFAADHPAFVAGREDATSLTIRPLTESQTEELVDELLSIADLPVEARQAIIERCEGNPFFIEEVLRRLIDQGALVRSADRWRASGTIDTADLPDTVHALLAARIDALPQTEKRVLQEAAVVGRIFWEEPVRRALGDGEVSDRLLALEARGLIAARPSSSIGGQVEYIFKHALVRDVAYAGLPGSRRARSHAAVAEWIEESAPDRRDEFLDLLAHYYEAAVGGQEADLAWADDAAGREGVRVRAFEALIDAGTAARRRYALKVALARHRGALALATDPAERTRALEAVGDDEEAAFHGEEGWDAYLQARDLARERGDLATVARVGLKAARIATKLGTFRKPPEATVVEELLDEALAAVGDDTELRALLLMQKGAGMAEMWRILGGPDPLSPAERLEATEEAARLARTVGRAALELEAEASMGAAYWNVGDYDKALASARRQLELLPRVDSASARAMAYYDASQTLRDVAGDWQGSLELARKSLELGRGLSAHELMHGSAHAMLAAYWLGRWEEVPALVDEHLAAFAEEADRTCASVRGGVALAALWRANRGETEEADELLGLIRSHLVPASLRFRSGDTLAALAYIAAGRPAEATELTARAPAGEPALGWTAVGLLEAASASQDWKRVREVVPTARRLAGQLRMLGPIADRAEAQMLAAEGERPAAVVGYRRALEGFEQLELPFEAARTREALAALAEPGERRELLESALAVYERLEAVPHAARVREALGQDEPGGLATPPARG